MERACPSCNSHLQDVDSSCSNCSSKDSQGYQNQPQAGHLPGVDQSSATHRPPPDQQQVQRHTVHPGGGDGANGGPPPGQPSAGQGSGTQQPGNGVGDLANQGYPPHQQLGDQSQYPQPIANPGGLPLEADARHEYSEQQLHYHHQQQQQYQHQQGHTQQPGPGPPERQTVDQQQRRRQEQQLYQPPGRRGPQSTPDSHGHLPPGHAGNHNSHQQHQQYQQPYRHHPQHAQGYPQHAQGYPPPHAQQQHSEYPPMADPGHGHPGHFHHHQQQQQQHLHQRPSAPPMHGGMAARFQRPPADRDSDPSVGSQDMGQEGLRSSSPDLYMAGDSEASPTSPHDGALPTGHGSQPISPVSPASSQGYPPGLQQGGLPGYFQHGGAPGPSQQGNAPGYHNQGPLPGAPDPSQQGNAPGYHSQGPLPGAPDPSQQGNAPGYHNQGPLPGAPDPRIPWEGTSVPHGSHQPMDTSGFAGHSGMQPGMVGAQQPAVADANDGELEMWMDELSRIGKEKKIVIEKVRTAANQKIKSFFRSRYQLLLSEEAGITAAVDALTSAPATFGPSDSSTPLGDVGSPSSSAPSAPQLSAATTGWDHRPAAQANVSATGMVSGSHPVQPLGHVENREEGMDIQPAGPAAASDRLKSSHQQEMLRSPAVDPGQVSSLSSGLHATDLEAQMMRDAATASSGIIQPNPDMLQPTAKQSDTVPPGADTSQQVTTESDLPFHGTAAASDGHVGLEAPAATVSSEAATATGAGDGETMPALELIDTHSAQQGLSSGVTTATGNNNDSSGGAVTVRRIKTQGAQSAAPDENNRGSGDVPMDDSVPPPDSTSFTGPGGADNDSTASDNDDGSDDCSSDADYVSADGEVGHETPAVDSNVSGEAKQNDASMNGGAEQLAPSPATDSEKKQKKKKKKKKRKKRDSDSNQNGNSSSEPPTKRISNGEESGDAHSTSVSPGPGEHPAGNEGESQKKPTLAELADAGPTSAEIAGAGDPPSEQDKKDSKAAQPRYELRPRNTGNPSYAEATSQRPGTFQRKGSEGELFPGKAKKAAQHEPQQQSVENQNTARIDTSHTIRRDCIRVTFKVLLAPEWKFEHGDQMAMFCSLTNFKVPYFLNILGTCGPQDLYHVCEVSIDVPLTARRVVYKYAKWHPTKKLDWEILPQEASSYNYINRLLDIPNDQVVPGGIFIKHDDVIRTKTSKSIWGSIKDTVKELAYGDKRPLVEREIALQNFIPQFDPNHDTFSPFEQINRTLSVATQFKQAKYFESTQHSSYPKKWECPGHDGVMKEVVFRRNLALLADMQLSMSAVDRLVSGLSLCLLVKKLGIALTIDEGNTLMTMLSLAVDEKNRTCPDVDVLMSRYAGAERSQFIEGLTHFINHVRELNKKKPFWQFLWMMPLLHFLTEDTTPFAIPPPNNQSTGKNLERWWGVHYLKGSGFEFGEMMEEAGQQLRGLLAADQLLERNFLLMAGLARLADAARIIQPLPNVLLRALAHHVRERNATTIDARGVLSVIARCADLLQPLTTKWLEDDLMSGSVRNQFAMAASTVKQGLAVLQELNDRATTATPRDDMRRTLITFLDVHFRLMVKYQASYTAVEKEKREQKAASERGSQENSEKGDAAQQEKEAAAASSSAPNELTDEAMDVSDEVQGPTPRLQEFLRNNFQEVITVATKLSRRSTELLSIFSHQDHIFQAEIQFWNDMLRFDGLDELGLAKEWSAFIVTLLAERLQAMASKEKLERLCVLQIDRYHQQIGALLSQSITGALDDLIKRGDAGKNVFQSLKGVGKGMGLLSRLLHQFVGTKLKTASGDEEIVMLESLLTWNCWPSYINNFWRPSMSSGKGSDIGLEAEAAGVLAQGISSLETLLERFNSGDICVAHAQLSARYKSQLVQLCEEMDKAHRRGNPQHQGSLATRVQAQVKNCMSLIGELEEKKKRLTSLFGLCRQVEIVVSDGKLLDEVVHNPLTERSLNDLKRLFAYSPDVGEMLESFIIACTNPLFVKLCKDRCKILRNEDGVALAQPLSLTLDQICTRLFRPVMKDWSEYFVGTHHGTISLRNVEYCFERIDLEQLLQCMTKSCIVAGLCDKVKYENTRWIKDKVDRIKDYFEVLRVRKAATSILSIRSHLELEGDFSDIEFICAQTSDEFKNSPLDAITDRIVNASQFLKKMEEPQMKCLDAFAKCGQLVDWLRQEVKELKQLTTFVDLAAIATGEFGDMDADRISFLHTSCTGYAGLIYQLPATAGFHEFMKACVPAFRALEGDPNLPKKLIDTQRNLTWLKSVRQSQESVSVTSFTQAEAINTRGVYTIKVPSMDSGELPTLDKCVELLIPASGSAEESVLDNKTYNIEKIKDLHSKLVLVSGKQELRIKIVNNFMEVYEGVCRVANALVEHCTMGSTQYLDWHKQYFCDRDAEGSCKVVLDELATDGARLEADLDSWKQDMRTSREQFYQLNFFTMRQLIQLRRELARIHGRSRAPSDDIPYQVYALLSCLKPNVTAAEIHAAVLSGMSASSVTQGILETAPCLRRTRHSSQSKHSQGGILSRVSTSRTVLDSESDDDSGSLLSELTSRGFTERVACAALKVHPGNLSKALKWAQKYGDNKKKLELVENASESESDAEVPMDTGSGEVNAIPHSGRAESRVRPASSALSAVHYLSLNELGRVLLSLHNKTKPKAPCSLPKYITKGKPNLLVVPGSDIFGTVLDLYRYDTTSPLPTAPEVLVCTAETTAEEVILLWRRAIFSKQLHCLVNADKLDYSVSSAVIQELRQLLETVRTHYSECSEFALVIVCCRENEEHTWIMSALEDFRTMSTPCVPPELRKYLLAKFRKLGSELMTNDHPWQPAARLDSEESCVRLVTSTRAGVGKSLYIKRLQDRLGTLDVNQPIIRENRSASIPVQGNTVNIPAVMDMLLAFEPKHDIPMSRIFHIDVAPTIQSGLDTFLFNLLILGTLSDSVGRTWQRAPTDLYIVEVTCDEMAFNFLSSENKFMSNMAGVKSAVTHNLRLPFFTLLPAHLCGTPLQAYQAMLSRGNKGEELSVGDPQLDRFEFTTRQFQRVFGYLIRHVNNESMDRYTYMPGQTAGDPLTCLKLLLSNCGTQDPSWLVLHHFVHFLDAQLADCEQSVFCNMMLVGEELSGFRSFVVRFLLRMSVDFATPSLDVAADIHEAAEEMLKFTLRRRWEQCPHPYLFFNNDHMSMTFVGFNVEKNGNLVGQEGELLEKDIMSRRLHGGLRAQGVDLQENFNSWDRMKRLGCLCKVLGQDSVYDVDDSYELTLDNVKKILAIQMRFRCGIPVVVMGETGCGKTRLIRFMCQLQAGFGGVANNMLIMKIHGGTTEEHVRKRVKEAEEIAITNSRDHNIDTVLFFDEANTSNALGMIKEVMCDRRVNGRAIADNIRLRFIAACNPYRRHTAEMIRRLEEAGLGYHVRSTETEDKLGRIPLRQLVYRVHPLPGSMSPLVWDFGQLNADVEKLYVHQIVLRYIRKQGDFPEETDLIETITNVLSAAQAYMREQKDECSFVSLRDVERAMMVMKWFYWLCGTILDELIQAKEDVTYTVQTAGEGEVPIKRPPPLTGVTRALVLSLGVCYQARLRDRDAFRRHVAQAFTGPCPLSDGAQQIKDEIDRCQEVFLDQLQLGPNIARNKALRENVFMMVVCIDTRIPLFLVGKPGSSKSLAKTEVADAMLGDSSLSPLFRCLKQVHMVSYQCSPLSTPDGIVGTFKQCQQFQKDKNKDRFVAAVVLDEVGLAEDSPRLPLKALHPLLEDGTGGGDDSSQTEQGIVPIKDRVAFVGISNWALDPAKMNRGIMVSRGEPDDKELESTATDICSTNPEVQQNIAPLINHLAKAYRTLYKDQDREFFGLRDFYSLVKMVYSYSAASERPPTWPEIEVAVRRNFGGLSIDRPVKIFRDLLGGSQDMLTEVNGTLSTLDLIKASLHSRESVHYHGDSRYLLILSENCDAALDILQNKVLDPAKTVVIFGSSFPKDQEYTQVCRDINRIKVCMETGQTVVLLNLENLYESLYDALNQSFVNLGGEKYVDLGLGTHRVKCRVDSNFRLIVIAKRRDVEERFPIPLINRLEKHFLALSAVLSPQQADMAVELQTWVRQFSEMRGGKRNKQFKEGDAFTGYHQDTAAALILHACEDLPIGTSLEVRSEGSHAWQDCVIQRAKYLLMMMCPPDALARLPHTALEKEAQHCWDVYFGVQHHESLVGCVQRALSNLTDGQSANPGSLSLQVTTHSRLLSNLDAEQIAQSLSLSPDSLHCLLLQQFHTEQQFCREVSEFFQVQSTDSSRVLFVQCDEGDQHTDLLACARHRLHEERVKAAEIHVREGRQISLHVVFIIQLPRKAGGCFEGAQGGLWRSAHIDELRPSTSVETPNVTSLVGRSVSELFCKSIKTHFGNDAVELAELEEAMDVQDHEQARTSLLPEKFEAMDVTESIGNSGSEKVVSLGHLLSTCIQEAVSRLDDIHGPYEVVESRICNRIFLFQSLLSNTNGTTGRRFLGLLTRHILKVLQERDEKSGVNANTWVQNEALTTRSLHEGGTFQRALWLKLQSIVCPILSEVIAAFDCCINLDLLDEKHPLWLRNLWLDLFADPEVISLSYHTMLVEDSSQMRDRVPVMACGAQNHSFGCQLPFSWRVKAITDAFLPQAANTSANSNQPVVVCLRDALLSTNVGQLLRVAFEANRDGVAAYLSDYIRMTHYTVSQDAHDIVNTALFTAQKELQLSDKLQPVFDVASIHVAHGRIQARLHCMLQLLSRAPADVVRRSVSKVSSCDSVPEMVSDLLVLQCVLANLTPTAKCLSSAGECQRWLASVRKVSSPIDSLIAALERDGSGRLGAQAQNLMDTCRPLWARLNAVRLFLEHVTLICDREPYLFYASHKLFTTLPMDADFCCEASMAEIIAFLNGCVTGKFYMQTQDSCQSCHKEPINARRLPCAHVLCITCLAAARKKRPAKCPGCSAEIPSGIVDTKQDLNFEHVKNITKFKEQSNKFFMDLVSSLCFSITSGAATHTPEPALMELLLNMVSGQRTIRYLSPFQKDDDSEQQVVVRSFLLQLLLRFSENQVIEHVRRYLAVAVGFSSEQAYSDELCLLFVHCLEDALHSHWADMKDRSGENHAIKMVIETLGLAQTTINNARWEEQPTADVAMLQAVSGVRFALTYAAEHISKRILSSAPPAEGNHEWRRKVDNLIQKARTLCDDTGPTINIFLIKQVVRRVGLDTFRSAMEDQNQDLTWMMPDKLKRDENDEAVPDRFLLLGQRYRDIREATAGAVLSADTSKLENVAKPNQRTKRGVSVQLLLALYREVTMCRAEPVEQQPQTEQSLEKLRLYCKNNDIMRKESKDLALQLVDNEQGSALPNMRVTPRQSGMVRSLSALVIHFIAMLVECSPRNKLLEVFSKLAFNPTSMVNAFFPTMPEDHLQDVRAAMGGAWYECPKGHPYYISECGQPMQDYQCPDCGSRIGGGQHRLYQDNRAARSNDQTQSGHNLGQAVHRDDVAVPERDLNPAATSLMRILLHMSLVWAASASDQGKITSLAGMVHPALPPGTNVGQFFWTHLECDIKVFAKATGKGIDHVLLGLHHLFATMTECKANSGVGCDLGLSNRTTRRRWEKAFEQEFFSKFFETMEEGVTEAQRVLMKDERLGKDKLMRAVFEVESRPSAASAAQDGSISHLDPSLWRYRVRASINGLMHMLGPQKENYPVLHTFLHHEHTLRAIQYLPDIVQLQRRLVDRYSRRIDRKTAEEVTIKRFLADQTDADKEMLGSLITAYEDAWMLVREQLYQHGRLKPSEECRYDVIKGKSPLTFLLPTTEGFGRNPTALVDFLVSAHNEFLEAYGGVMNMKVNDFQRVSLLDATHAQLISYDAGRHLLPLVLAHCHYTVEAGQGMLVQYDLAALEKHLEQRFIISRPMVDMAEIRLVFSEDVHNTSQMMALRRRVRQVELSKAVQQQIVAELNDLTDICSVISNLEIGIGFLMASGGSSDMLLADYMESVLKMRPDTALVSRKLRHSCMLQHILSAWRLMVVQRTNRLMDLHQDAFEDVADIFKVEIDRAQRQALGEWLSGLVQRDALLGELLEFIVVELKERHAERNASWPDWALCEAMDQYGCRLEGLDEMPYELECQHAVSVWASAARMSRAVAGGSYAADSRQMA